MVKCDYCGKEEYMPFRCKYCGGYFCAEHRLPELHNCTGDYQASRSTTGYTGFTPTGYSYTPPRSARTLGLFGRNELRDLGIGLGVIMLILLSGSWRYLFSDPLFMLGALLIYGLAFILHELAHKFPLKIIAPGAVMIGNIASWDHYGKVSIAGPATNIGMGIIFFMIALVSGNPMVYSLARIGVNINASLALFNLLPFGIFDGAKIIKWNKYTWGAAVLAAGILYLVRV